MDEMEATIRKLIDERIRPRARVDGGDIKFEGLDGLSLRIGAYADCATCPCCEVEFPRWIESYVKAETDLDVRVSVNRHVPYYAR